jgi:hypothetical protein
MLQPNEARDVIFQLRRSDFSYVDASGGLVFDPGSFTVMIGGLAKEVVLR